MNSTILSEFSHQAENGSFRGTKTCHTWKSSPETKFSGYLHCSTSEPQPGLAQGIPGKLLGEKPLEHPFMGQAGGPDRRRVLPLLQNLDDKEVLCLQLFSSPPFCCKRKGSQTLPVQQQPLDHFPEALTVQWNHLEVSTSHHMQDL